MKKGKSKDEYGSQANLVDNMAPPDVSADKEKTDAAITPAASKKHPKVPEPLEERVLTPDEKNFLLNVERGDTSGALAIIKSLSKRPQIFDINCVDPLGRSALIISVENENIDMMMMLVQEGIKLKDALLVAIREDYVDGTEFLLKHEEETHAASQPYSWEAMDPRTANFTADMTPLILASHRNNYEILKMLLDRGATIPVPHDVKCSCDECVSGAADDSLRFSLARNDDVMSSST